MLPLGPAVLVAIELLGVAAEIAGEGLLGGHGGKLRADSRVRCWVLEGNGGLTELVNKERGQVAKAGG